MKDLKDHTGTEIEEIIAIYRKFMKEQELPDETATMTINTLFNYVTMFINEGI